MKPEKSYNFNWLGHTTLSKNALPLKDTKLPGIQQIFELPQAKPSYVTNTLELSNLNMPKFLDGWVDPLMLLSTCKTERKKIESRNLLSNIVCRGQDIKKKPKKAYNLTFSNLAGTGLQHERISYSERAIQLIGSPSLQ